MNSSADRVDVVVVGVSEASHARTVQLASELSVLSGKPKGDVQFALLGGQFVVHRSLTRDAAREVADRLRELGAEIEIRPSAVTATPAPAERKPSAVPPRLEPDQEYDLPTAPTIAKLDPPSVDELGPPPEFGELTPPPSKLPSSQVPTHRHKKRPTGELDPSRPHGRLQEGQAEWPFSAESKPQSSGEAPAAPDAPKRSKADSSEDLPRRVRPSSRAERPPIVSKAGSIDPQVEKDERIPTGPYDTVDAH